MKDKLTSFLIAILAIGFLTLLGHEINLWGPSKEDVGVVYLQDYDCSMKYTHAKEELEAYVSVLHRIWIDNPRYVEDHLVSTKEFRNLDSISNNGDIFAFWSEEDSLAYYRHMRESEPDDMPLQTPLCNSKTQVK